MDNLLNNIKEFEQAIKVVRKVQRRAKKIVRKHEGRILWDPTIIKIVVKGKRTEILYVDLNKDNKLIEIESKKIFG